MSLASAGDLASASPGDPNTTNAAASVLRMKDGKNPMPPAGNKPTAEEVAAFEAWVEGGMPAGACVEPDPSAQTATTVCTSGKTFNSRKEDANMNPGLPCIACHQKEERKAIVAVGGTVYPTLHEPDLCLGLPGDVDEAEVVITDAAGKETRLGVGANGNFSARTRDVRFTFPIRAKVVYGGRELEMKKEQSSGDCNSCHTESGTEGAPGRITLP